MGKTPKKYRKEKSTSRQSGSAFVLVEPQQKTRPAWALSPLDRVRIIPQQTYWEVINYGPYTPAPLKGSQIQSSEEDQLFEDSHPDIKPDTPEEAKLPKYQVIKHPKGGWACTCPFFHYQKTECKHIAAVKTGLRMYPEQLSTPYPFSSGEEGEDEKQRFLFAQRYYPLQISSMALSPREKQRILKKIGNRQQVYIWGELRTVENPFGIRFLQKEDRPPSTKTLMQDKGRYYPRKYAIEVIAFSKSGEKVRIGYLRNQDIRNYPELLDPNKRIRVLIQVQKTKHQRELIQPGERTPQTPQKGATITIQGLTMFAQVYDVKEKGQTDAPSPNNKSKKATPQKQEKKGEK